MKTYEMPVTLTIKFEAENEKQAMELLTFMFINPKFEEKFEARLLDVEEDWGELQLLK